LVKMYEHDSIVFEYKDKSSLILSTETHHIILTGQTFHIVLNSLWTKFFSQDLCRNLCVL